VHLGHLSLGEKCSPRLKLIETTSVPETASRNPAIMSAVAVAALSRKSEGIRTTRRVAAGATACTVSTSWISSLVACHGEAEPARVVTTSSRAAGSLNMLSNAFRAWRISAEFGP